MEKVVSNLTQNENTFRLYNFVDHRLVADKHKNDKDWYQGFCFACDEIHSLKIEKEYKPVEGEDEDDDDAYVSTYFPTQKLK